MTDQVTGDISYKLLLADSSLLSIFSIGFIVASGISAVPVALPEIARALTLSDAQVGLVMTAFFLPMIFLIPLTSVLADLYGRTHVVLPSLFLLAVSGPLTLLVTTFPALLALRVVQGVATAATLPLTAAMIGDLYRGAEGTAAQGLRTSANSLGATLGPLLAGVLASIGWQYPFLLFGLTAPAMGAIYWYYDDPVAASVDSATELRDELRTYVRSLRVQAANSSFALLSLGGFTLFFMKQALKTFLPLFMVRELGTPVFLVGVVLGIYSLVRMVAAPLAGLLVDRTSHTLVLLGALGCLVASLIAMPFTPQFWWLVPAVGLFATGEAFLNPTLMDTIATFATDDSRGGLMSGIQSLKNVGNTVAPAVLGVVLATSGFTSLYALTAALGGVYGLGLLVWFDQRSIST